MASPVINIPGLNLTNSPTIGSILRNPIDDILLGSGAIAGAMPTPTNQSGSGTSSTTSLNDVLQSLIGSQNISGTATSSYQLTPEEEELLRSITSGATSLTQTPDLTGYTQGQISNINRNANLASQAANNIMAARGLSTSPVAATTQANINNQRVGNITQLQQQIPLLANQLKQQNLGQAASILASLPKAVSQSTTGATSTNQQSTNTGSSTQNQNYNNQVAQKSGGGLGGLFGGIGSILASLF